MVKMIEREIIEKCAEAAEHTAEEYGGLIHFAFKRFAMELRSHNTPDSLRSE